MAIPDEKSGIAIENRYETQIVLAALTVCRVKGSSSVSLYD